MLKLTISPQAKRAETDPGQGTPTRAHLQPPDSSNTMISIVITIISIIINIIISTIIIIIIIIIIIRPGLPPHAALHDRLALWGRGAHHVLLRVVALRPGSGRRTRKTDCHSQGIHIQTA